MQANWFKLSTELMTQVKTRQIQQRMRKQSIKSSVENTESLEDSAKESKKDNWWLFFFNLGTSVTILGYGPDELKVSLTRSQQTIYPNAYCNARYSLQNPQLSDQQIHGIRTSVPIGFENHLVCSGMETYR